MHRLKVWMKKHGVLLVTGLDRSEMEKKGKKRVEWDDRMDQKKDIRQIGPGLTRIFDCQRRLCTIRCVPGGA